MAWAIPEWAFGGVILVILLVLLLLGKL